MAPTLLFSDRYLFQLFHQEIHDALLGWLLRIQILKAAASGVQIVRVRHVPGASKTVQIHQKLAPAWTGEIVPWHLAWNFTCKSLTVQCVHDPWQTHASFEICMCVCNTCVICILYIAKGTSPPTTACKESSEVFILAQEGCKNPGWCKNVHRVYVLLL